jgi:hypothetical protein
MICVLMTKAHLVLKLLVDAGESGVETGAFLREGCGSRFGARVQELRESGAVIDARRERAGSYRYTLRRCPEPPAAVPPGVATVEPLQLFEPAEPAPSNALCWDEEAAA